MNDQHHTHEEQEPREERWVYAGLRILRGATMQAWVTDSGNGEVVYFTPRGVPIVGDIYRAKVVRKGTALIIFGQPYRAEDGRAAPSLAASLLAEHRATKARLAGDRLKRSAATRDELHVALEPAREIARKLRTQVEREAFTAFVLHELLAAWKDTRRRP